ncbi:MAG TPA: OmpH family outer membrane protein [Lacunisphaera sp.]|nr:OmpH family outer membrane protein [Lacunisphaera sp.]
MKFPRLLLSLFGLVLGTIAPAATPAAAPATTPATTSATAAAAPKLLPVSRVAWINTSAFVAEEGGIKDLVRVMKQLELEFSGTQSELSLLTEKLRTIVGEIQKLQAGGEANAAAIQEKQSAGVKIQQELRTKQQEAQAAIQQAQQEKQGPIAQEIGKALTAYAKEREIGLLFDVSKLGDGVIAAQPELEITNDFIAYYNASHP